MNYLFHLGHTPSLSTRELSAYLTREKIKFAKHSFSPHELLITTKKQLDLDKAISTLAGSIRIASQITKINSSSQDQITQQLVAFIKSTRQSKPSFSITPLGLDLDSTALSKTIKQELAKSNIKSRFLLPAGQYLTPLQVKNNQALELILIRQDDSIIVFQTQVVSDVLSWQKRDRSRPSLDPKSGIMPPKVARMLVNLALTKPPDKDTLIYDPFCGSGTILSEALMLGCSVVGSDNDPSAIDSSTKNLAWLSDQYQLSGSHKLFKTDVKELSADKFAKPLSAIVTEGYLGPSARQDKTKLLETIDVLAEFYKKSITNLRTLLSSGGRLVIALPLLPHSASVKSLSNLIDSCENSGYTRLSGPIIYSRPQARVKRAIYILQKT